MSAQTDQQEQTGTDVIAEARTMGWVPKEEFKGDENKWVDADKFVEHGRAIQPILRKNNERLTTSVRSLEGKIEQLTKELKARDSDIENIQTFYNEQLVERVADARKQAMADIKKAREDDDLDAETDALDRLTKINGAAKDLDKQEAAKKPDPEQPTDVQPSPAHLRWATANKDWFGIDPVRSSLAVGYGQAVRQEFPDLTGDAFYEEVDRRLAEDDRGYKKPDRTQSKVGGSRGGATGQVSGKRTYSDLPAEAKAACDKYADQFVNPNGRWKTQADYRAHYIKQLEDTGYFN